MVISCQEANVEHHVPEVEGRIVIVPIGGPYAEIFFRMDVAGHQEVECPESRYWKEHAAYQEKGCSLLPRAERS